MPIQIHWEDDTHQLVRQIFTPPWTFEEHKESYKVLMTQIAEQQHTVNLIADLTHSEVSMSKFLLSTTQLARIGVPENLGTIVFANGNRFVTAIERVADTYVPRVKGNMHFVQNLDDAYEILNYRSNSPGG